MIGPRRRRKNLRPADRLGAEIAELAFALPIMTTLVFGSLELCELLFLKQSLAVASYETGRLAARPDSTSQVVKTRFEQIMTNRRVGGATIQLTPAEIATAKRGDLIEVRVTAPVVGNTSTHLVVAATPPVSETTYFIRE